MRRECQTHFPLTSGFVWGRWRGKRSRRSQRTYNPQFYVSGKRPVHEGVYLINYAYSLVVHCFVVVILSDCNRECELFTHKPQCCITVTNVDNVTLTEMSKFIWYLTTTKLYKNADHVRVYCEMHSESNDAYFAVIYNSRYAVVIYFLKIDDNSVPR